MFLESEIVITAIFIGRFQPFHDGHKKLFLNVLKKNKQVAILVMYSYKIDNKKGNI